MRDEHETGIPACTNGRARALGLPMVQRVHASVLMSSDTYYLTPVCRCVVLVVNAEFRSCEGLEESSSHLGLLHLAEAVVETLVDHIRCFRCDEKTVDTAKAHRL